MSETSDRSGGLLDLQPMIRKRKQDACEHDHAEVSLSTAELDCVDCGAPIDPWWYLRKLATEDEQRREYNEEFQREVDKQTAQGRAAIERLNADIQKANAEIRRLIEMKNTLQNERMPDGRTLGTHAAGRRRRRTRDWLNR